MSRAVDLPGAAHLVLADGVVHLDPEPAVFEAMLDGWTLQQRARFLDWEQTIKPRLRLIRRFAEFTNEYPWQWTPMEAEAFIDHLRSRRERFAVSTGRSYQNALRLFCDYVTDARYGWPLRCHERFGAVPAQILHEWNTITHSSDYEGRPERRPLTYDEVQALFDAADGRVEEIRARRRKGSMAALRDSVTLKTVYAFGLRRQEACWLDLPDLRRNPKAAEYGRIGALFVRYGKASKGGPPKRRTVLTVPEFDWIVEVLERYLEEVRPAFAPAQHPALWVTDRRGRLSLRRLDEAFETARVLAGLPEELDLHCLRHSYVTHLVEFDYPERFVQEQVGHLYASTTALYTGVSDDYRTRLVQRALQARHAGLWEAKA
ncbi:tyrosine-type recombinase/integrase [Streptacidiphilus sp. P02-A3a]|uniref:tyrosine-type recombinase/integrase n=1 Tax=Streptacidiphilus sp. P02-A3a TaxID=2704468 RepID=UPI0015FB4591|nr:tyrosine-type recombinase/integrase [Streptacidiphilus sp. P02-A3a]QMU67294.1 tyrosine-type recombinase/integrase [Streptacidiphilus sp. P02-A3a]